MDASPIIDFYPPDFRTDLNGKQQEWEAVVLIPFIDEVNLKNIFKVTNRKTGSFWNLLTINITAFFTLVINENTRSIY